MSEWHRHDPDALPWEDAGEGAQVKQVSGALSLLRLRAGARHQVSARSLLLVSGGQISAPGLGTAVAGDLAWLPSTQVLEAVAGATCYCLQIPDSAGSVDAVLIDSSRIDWQEFDDPHGRPTQPVQVLLDGPLSILRTRFVPEFSAAAHWHDFDTWYFISEGRMRFGHEGWYERGQVRQVTGGYSYGPEEPGAEGVEFVLVSVGGPVALHWADLEPPPRGPLPA